MAPLDGRVALVTGVSRRQGIGFAIARRLLLDGASVFVSGWEPHDAEMPWGADAAGPDAVAGELDPGDGRFVAAPVDLGDPDGPRRLVDAAVERFGTLDVLVANHARSSSQDLAALTVDELDRCWAVNTRATLLLVQALAGLCRRARWPSGARLVLRVNRCYGYALRSTTSPHCPAACAITCGPHANSGLGTSLVRIDRRPSATSGPSSIPRLQPAPSPTMRRLLACDDHDPCKVPCRRQLRLYQLPAQPLGLVRFPVVKS
jgi:hypothetical protein